MMYLQKVFMPLLQEDNSLFENIRCCKSCSLCNNQPPLLSPMPDASPVIMVVGTSAKQIKSPAEVPLDGSTRSGKIVSRLEAVSLKCGYGIYRTNLVKCPPVNDVNKLRYPTKEEIAACIGNLFQEIELLTPKIVLLLGKIVISAMEHEIGAKFSDYSGCTFSTLTVGHQRYVAAYHPSFVSKSPKLTEEYVSNFAEMLTREFGGENS